MLAEFNSVVNAVRCAVEVQRGMAERNTNVPEEKRIEFRIGVNLGDVIIDSGDLFGNGVNVAVRLEGIADPGGICVSERVRSQARSDAQHFEAQGSCAVSADPRISPVGQRACDWRDYRSDRALRSRMSC
jgi:class 3 adenylate cyclase